MKSITKRRIIVGLLLVVGFSFLIKRCIKAISSYQHSFDSIYLYKGKFDKEDSLLFKIKELKNIKITQVIESNYRYDIKSFNDRNNNIITYTKIDLIKDEPLIKLIKFRNESTSSTTMHPYHVMASKSNEFLILSEKNNKVDSLILSFKGENKKLQKKIQNENFISYYLPATTVSLKYGEDKVTDIFFGGKEGFLGIRKMYPFIISFYKIQKSIYLMILIPNKDDANLDPDFFEKIMNDNTGFQND